MKTNSTAMFYQRAEFLNNSIGYSQYVDMHLHNNISNISGRSVDSVKYIDIIFDQKILSDVTRQYY